MLGHKQFSHKKRIKSIVQIAKKVYNEYIIIYGK